MAYPKIAVVIPAWNSLDDLRPCLDSLAARDEVEVETFVVDNGSVDGTVAFLEEAGVAHLALPQNLGFARAVNIGVLRTTSPLVAVLNADTVLESGALSRLAARLEGAEGALGGVQPRILQLDSEGPGDPDDPDAVVYSLGQALRSDGRAYERGAGSPQGRPETQPREVFGVCGAACVLRRELLAALGGYDERYFAFYEDVDLNVRARIAGWRFELEPRGVVWHRGNVSWRASFGRPEPRQRAPRGAQPARDPGQVHARRLDPADRRGRDRGARARRARAALPRDAAGQARGAALAWPATPRAARASRLG